MQQRRTESRTYPGVRARRPPEGEPVAPPRNRTTLRLAGLAAGLLLAAQLAAQPTSPPIGKEEAMTQWRWIGIKSHPGQACPAAGGIWQVAPLFPTAADDVLADFCLYTATSFVSPSELQPLQALLPHQLIALDADLLVVAPAAGAFSTLQPFLQGELLQQAGHVSLSALDHRSSPVRLALLDTSPTDSGVPQVLSSNSPHGRSLLEMADKLLCPEEGPCLAQVTSRLALSYLEFHREDPDDSERDLIKGGFVGTIGELAEAIGGELEDWSQTSPGQRLILNLSVAWDPRFGGEEAGVKDMSTPVQAVYRALQKAACSGALAVAAAGNTTRGPTPTSGPMLPAAWEERPAPDPKVCRGELGFPAPDSRPVEKSSSAYRPLVHAVAGVDRGGLALGNARAASVARLAAYGDHASVTGRLTADPTPLLTGSSVSAVVVSAAAAAVWHHLPELPAADVVQRIYEGGESLARPADFCLRDGNGNCVGSAGALDVHRASVCGAVAAACTASGGSCAAPACGNWPVPPSSGPSITASPGAGANALAITEPHPTSVACGTQATFYDPALGPGPLPDPCPSLQYHGLVATPWVSPQPGSDPCPTCTFYRGQSRLYLEIDPNFSGFLSQPTLVFCGSSFSLGGLNLTPGVMNHVDNIDIAGCKTMRVSFRVGGGRSATSEVLILP